jgi:hypothetical protein
LAAANSPESLLVNSLTSDMAWLLDTGSEILSVAAVHPVRVASRRLAD